MADGGRATLKDVAERVGVHAGTVSRALNPKTRSMVNAATVRKVLRAAEELAYRPNPLAQGLKTLRTMAVGVILPDITNPLFPPIVRGIESVLSAEGYISFVTNTDNDPDREKEALEAFRARQVDGMIVASARLEDAALTRMAAAGTPIVLVNRSVDRAAIPQVVGDDAGGIHAAIEHLVRLGHRRIAHLAGPRALSTGAARARSFRQTMAELGVGVDEDLVVECGAFTVDAGAEGARQLLDRARPTAVLAGNDQIALGLLDVLLERGLRCPEDVSVVGYNDMPYIDKVSPPLTSVRVPNHRLGAEAARLLLRRMAGGDEGIGTITLPVELVERASTAPPPA